MLFSQNLDFRERRANIIIEVELEPVRNGWRGALSSDAMLFHSIKEGKNV